MKSPCSPAPIPFCSTADLQACSYACDACELDGVDPVWPQLGAAASDAVTRAPMGNIRHFDVSMTDALPVIAEASVRPCLSGMGREAQRSGARTLQTGSRDGWPSPFREVNRCRLGAVPGSMIRLTFPPL